MQGRWRTSIVVLASLSILTVGCSAPKTPSGIDHPEAVVEEAARAFELGFTSRDLSALEDYFAPGPNLSGRSETIDAAVGFLESMPQGTRLEIDSFDITDIEIGSTGSDAVVSYEAKMHVTLPGEIGSEIGVSQDVALEWHDNQWLITGADPAQVDGTLPQPP